MVSASRRYFQAVLWVVALAFSGAALAQAPDLATATSGVWRDVAARDVQPSGDRWIVPSAYRLVALDDAAFQQRFYSAPMEGTPAAASSPTVIALPLPDGDVGYFRIVETQVMAPELAARFPEIRTWSGQGIDDPSSTVWLDWGPHGFHAMVLSSLHGRVFIDPYARGDTTHYISYYTRDHDSPNRAAATRMPPVDPNGVRSAEIRKLIGKAKSFAALSSGTQLRTYRLAMAATKEYTNFFGGTKPQGLAAIVTAVNRVSGIYQVEVAIRMQLIANNDLIIRTNADPGSPVYTNNNGSAMLSQNQTNIDNTIGSANYDIGHVFSTGGGGVAFLGVPCEAGAKAGGVTGLPNPTGDAFYVDFVAHEIGHQYGGNHTFNGSVGNCSGGNRNGSTAYEPGSGSTIMAYAGICGSDDLQAHSDAYFHTISFDEIVAYSTVGQGNSCPVITATGNSIPAPSMPSGGFTIPISTPFELTGSATDADGDPLTYNWEEFDLGPAGPPGLANQVPLFRSWTATPNPTRTFPRLSNLLSNTLPKGEVLPSVSRTLNFHMTVRDNRATGGGVNYGTLAFNVSSAAGPFTVTAPNTNVTWPPGSTQSVTWNVANTASAPVSCANVDILLSTDGGNTFPTVLVAATPNDGSQPVTIPGTPTTTARIKVKCSTSVFFDISNVNFTIATIPGPFVTTNAASLVSQNTAQLNGTVSSNGQTTTVTFQYGPSLGYGTTVTATQSPLAAGAANAAVSAPITGLNCSTLYHFRVVGSNVDGTNNGGDQTFTTSTCTGTATTTTIASNLNPSGVGTPVTFTAQVTGTLPAGNVTFRDGGATIGGCGAQALTGSGNVRTATCTTSALVAGNHLVSATYNGDGANAPSTSPSLLQQVVTGLPGTAIVISNPYGTVSVQNATLVGNTISNFQPNTVIQIGSTPGAPNSFIQIDFQGLNVGSGNTLTLRSGASGQTVLLRDVSGAANSIGGTLQAQGGGGAGPPALVVDNPSGITIAPGGFVLGTSGLTLDALGATPTTGQNVTNHGVADGGPQLDVFAAGIKGGGAYKGNAMRLSTFGSANNPVNGSNFLLNGLQLYPGTGANVNVTLNAYGPSPQVLNLMINGNASVWMPSAWPAGVTLPQNNNALAPGAVRPPGTPEPAYGGGSMIVQATGSMTLVNGGTADFVFPGAIVLKAAGPLNTNGVLVNQGWTITGQAFQGIFLESPSIGSSQGNIQLYSNYPNWVNFSTFPTTPVRAFSLIQNPNGSASFIAADTIIPHLNTYSVINGIAVSGGCWTCAINPNVIDVYGP